MKVIFYLVVFNILLTFSCKKSNEISFVDKEIEREVSPYVTSGQITGIAIGILNNGTEKYYFYGTKNRTTGASIDENTIFEIGSITKIFTALLFADYVVKQQISLYDSINRYFPVNISVPNYNGLQIKFIHLLNHTSGLPSQPDNLPLLQPVAGFGETELKNYFNEITLNEEPGHSFKYSNLGMGLAGYLLARTFGSNYDTLLKTKIFLPLNMTHTVCNARDISGNNIVQGYYGTTPADFYIFSDIFAPSATIKSNLHDMMIFLKENIYCDNPELYNAIKLTQNKSFKVNDHFFLGLGWHILVDEHGDEIYWHNGGTRGCSSFIAFNNTTKEGVVVLINSYCTGTQDRIGIEIMNIIREN